MKTKLAQATLDVYGNHKHPQSKDTPLTDTRQSRLCKNIIIAKAGHPVAVLSPYSKLPKKRTPGALQGKLKIQKDFDTLPEELKEYFT